MFGNPWMDIKLQFFFFLNEDVFIPQHKNIRFMLGRESYNYVKSSVSDESSPKQGLTISFHKCNGEGATGHLDVVISDTQLITQTKYKT